MADLLGLGSLPKSWIPPHSIRELRQLVRYRHKLSQLRSGLKGQIHAVLGKEGVIPHLVEMWGPAGHVFLEDTAMGGAHEYRLESLWDLIEVHEREITALDQRIRISWVTMSVIGPSKQLNGIGPVRSTEQPLWPLSIRVGYSPVGSSAAVDILLIRHR